MSTTTDIHPLAAEYLERFRREAQTLPRAARAELLADIESHLTEATSPEMSDAEVLTELDRLGDPAEIIDAQQPARGAVPPARRGTQEWSAIFLLLFGGFIFGVGWIFGLVLLWSSNAWRTRDKWIGTLLFPGGLVGVFFLVGGLLVGTSTSGCSSIAKPVSVNGHAAQHLLVCTGGGSTGTEILGVVLLIVLVAIPILTAIYLARQAGKPQRWNFA